MIPFSFNIKCWWSPWAAYHYIWKSTKWQNQEESSLSFCITHFLSKYLDHLLSFHQVGDTTPGATMSLFSRWNPHPSAPVVEVHASQQTPTCHNILIGWNMKETHRSPCVSHRSSRLHQNQLLEAYSTSDAMQQNVGKSLSGCHGHTHKSAGARADR